MNTRASSAPRAQLVAVQADGTVIVYSAEGLEAAFGISPARAQRIYGWALVRGEYHHPDGGIVCGPVILARLRRAARAG